MEKKKWFSLAGKPVPPAMNKLPLVLIPSNLHCLEKFLVVLMLNYENGENGISVYLYT